MSDPDAKPCGCFRWVECNCAEARAARVEEQDAEIEALRAEVAVLNEALACEVDAKCAAVLALDEARASLAAVEIACGMPAHMISTTLDAHRNTAAADHDRAEAAEAEVARLREEGTFNEGVEAAAKFVNGDGTRSLWRVVASEVRTLLRPAPGPAPEVRCATFDATSIPPEARATMDADRKAAEDAATLCECGHAQALHTPKAHGDLPDACEECPCEGFRGPGRASHEGAKP